MTQITKDLYLDFTKAFAVRKSNDGWVHIHWLGIPHPTSYSPEHQHTKEIWDKFQEWMDRPV